MNTTTSSATVVRMKGSARSGASAATSSTVPTPSSSAAAARKARLKSSSVRSDGRAPMDGYKVQKTSGGGGPRRSVRPLPPQRAYPRNGAASATAEVAGGAGVIKKKKIAQLFALVMLGRHMIHPPALPGTNVI